MGVWDGRDGPPAPTLGAMRPPLLPLTLALLSSCSGPAPRPTPSPSQPPTSDRFADLRLDRARSTPFVFPTSKSDAPLYREDGRSPVARFEVVLPEGDGFVLHGTLPLPSGTWPDGGPPPLLSVASPRGELHPAQVEPLTRSGAGEVEVVALRAYLSQPSGLAPGERALFDVFLGEPDSPVAPPAIPAASLALCDPEADTPILLQARDIFGNLYRADLRALPAAAGSGERTLLESGPVQRVVRTYATLMPTDQARAAGPNRAPRPHLMGVHAYWTFRAGEERVGLDLRINNGATSGSRRPGPGEEPVGTLYWDSLELVLPPDWRVDPLVADPFFGGGRDEADRRVVTLVRPEEDGSLHMMPPQAQFHRRLTLRPRTRRPGGYLPLEGLAFARKGQGLWSWWNASSAHWFPIDALLPDWGPLRIGPLRGEEAMRSRLTRRRDDLRKTLRSGTPVKGVLAGPLMGWAQPAGVSVQGMTGGKGITYISGHQAMGAASPQGVEALMLQHRMNACRQPQAQYDRLGHIVGFEAWLDSKGRIPFDFRTNGRMVPPPFRLPCQGGPPSDPQARRVRLDHRRPPYDRGSPLRSGGRIDGGDGDLFAWMPHDGQHYARWTHPAMALAWLCGDALARDDLALAAETFHLMFHGAEHVHASWSDGVTLLQFERLAAAYPHHGLPLGRDQAWGIDAMCAAWRLADDPWRAAHREWFRRVGELLVTGAMPSGILERHEEPKLLEGRYAGAQAFECLFLEHAERCLIESVLADTEPELAEELGAVHQRALDYLFWGPVWACIEERGETVCGPRWHFATAPAGDFASPPYCDETHYGPRYLPPNGLAKGVDVTYVWGPLEYGMLLAQGSEGPTLDDRYLRRALTCDRAAGRWERLLSSLYMGAQRDGADTSGNWGSLVGRIQSLRNQRSRER